MQLLQECPGFSHKSCFTGVPAKNIKGASQFCTAAVSSSTHGSTDARICLPQLKGSGPEFTKHMFGIYEQVVMARATNYL